MLAMNNETRLALLRQWWQLPAATRKEVVSLSRSRRRHPDPEVAWVAWRWAETVLPVGAPEPGRLRNILSAIGFWLTLVIEMASAGDPVDAPEPRWLDRRRARRILRLGPPID
ncbi:hypothetical protein GCM10025331_48830 [Actinoplanes utahensis]|uniref:Uncharacterized protein n=2 Tax=Actinoplanes utahensis TaxID=1869 RepID=A0A0A6XBN6_ACTUT|nr:hypothetical protein MB27_10540 [Actinoplanes utahensis]GIF32695.1 hypothetical protein Aut01nite_56810 [Actinoplanes utahensis]